MKKQVIIFGSLLLFITLFMFCYQAIETEYGDLLVTIKWPTDNVQHFQSSSVENSLLKQEESVFLERSQLLKENSPTLSLKKKTIISEGKNNPLAIYNEIVLIRFTMEPGGLVFEFDLRDSVYTIQTELGIYNVIVEALDSQGTAMYRADTTEILIEPNKSNCITLRITANYPSVAPEFIGFFDVNSNNSGEYLLLWSSVPKSENYRLEEDYSNTFGSSQILYNGPDTTYQLINKEDGTYYYRVRAENDINESPWSNSIAFQVQNVSELLIETDSLADGTVGSVYASKVDASGGLLPYTWEVISGSLPPGLDADSSYENNVSLGIIGSPSETGTFKFTLEVTDSSTPIQTISKELSISISIELVHITTDSLPDGTVGSIYASKVDASGGLLPYSWELISGSLPPGLDADFCYENNLSLGITGNPLEPGTFEFMLEVTDSNLPEQTSSKELSITIDPRPLQITTESLKRCTEGEYYWDRIDAQGGSEGDWSWSLASGSLPDGVRLKDQKEFARLLGTADKAGEYTFCIMVTDNIYPDLSDTKEFTVIIYEPQGLTITTTSLPNATAGVSYSYHLQAVRGTPPYTWSETPASSAYRAGTGFAEGIYIDATGLFSGTCRDFPTIDQITFKVTDNSIPQQTRTKTFNFRILAGALYLSTSTSLSNGKVSTAYSDFIMYLQGTPPLKTPWTFGGDWPIPGLSASYSEQNYKMTLSGTPTTADTYNFTVTVKDSSTPQKTRFDSFTITIDP